MAFDAETFLASRSQPSVAPESANTLAKPSVAVDPLSLTTPRERLEYMRDFLRELPPERFNIRNLYSRNGSSIEPRDTAVGELVQGCGTAACIAGWACAIFSPAERGSNGNWDAVSARDILGLSDDHRGELFMPSGYSNSPEDFTATRAALVIDHLLQTGAVDWSVARAEA